jgi:hypothetical protein
VPKALTYADAVRLLGRRDSPLVRAIDLITGGLVLGAGAVFPTAVLGWLDARDEFVRLCRELVDGVSEHGRGLGRLDRTQRIAAAHTVVVVTAFFEAVDAAELPFRFADLKLTRSEQLAVAGAPTDETGFVAAVLAAGEILPEPHGSQAGFERQLSGYYGRVAYGLERFVSGLAVGDEISVADWGRFTGALARVPDRACQRYTELIRALAAQFPEVACWIDRREHEATRAEVRTLEPALARLERMLTTMTSGRRPDERRAGMVRAYRAALDRPVIEPGEIPSGLGVPTLGAAYVPPLFRVVDARSDVATGEEFWWADVPVRDDLSRYLAGHLTSPRATQAPILVLGQPGAGKSVLARVLAARLPAADFLPVLVTLREVSATADLQDQIEQAVRAATGERVDWPALARSSDGALPVVLLDGFDELLQATGVRQTDYLTRVAMFQQREADLGRAVAVVVTTRTSVADRAPAPPGTLLLRLEPFDEPRIATWLDTWNRTNAEHFRAHDLTPLTAQDVLAYPELAGQPLLLLMLALYDADGNALRRGAAPVSRGDLYDRLLRSFARREVTRHRPDLAGRDLDRAVDDELRRLSLVAFAMFNRASQWVTEPDLERDLLAVFGPAPVPAVAPGFRAPLAQAELVLGRFFFIHRARAVRDNASLHTYEFLHATFGEYLVAWLTWQVLADTAARAAAATLPMADADDDLLHALLSFAVLTARGPTVKFLVGMAERLTAPERRDRTALLIRLFRAADQPRGARGFTGYEPLRLPVPTRHAAYRANLLVLVLLVAGARRASELFGPGEPDVRHAWHSLALLWHAQLRDEEWTSLVDAVEVERTWTARGECDVFLRLAIGPYRPAPIDPYWSCERTEDRTGRYTFVGGHNLDFARRRAQFQSGAHDDMLLHALAPLLDSTLGPSVRRFVGEGGEPAVSAAHALVDVWLLPLRQVDPEERRSAYERCASFATSRSWDEATRIEYTSTLLRALAVDLDAPTALVADILTRIKAPGISYRPTIALLQCGLAALDRDSGDASAARIIRLLQDMADLDTMPAGMVDRLTRLAAGARPEP